MSDRQTRTTKDRRVAEWCGWVFVPERYENGVYSKAHWKKGFVWLDNPPSYTTSLNACAEFERLVEERGLDGLYWVEVMRVVTVAHQGTPPADGFNFKLITATAEQRVDALLAVIEKGEKDG